MDTNQQSDFARWLKKLNSGESLGLSLWQEAMEQTRQLHTDIWNGVIFFFTVNGILIAATFTIAAGDSNGSGQWMLVFALVIVGLIVTLVGLRVFKTHRERYVQMLLRKTLIEKELGFYRRLQYVYYLLVIGYVIALVLTPILILMKSNP